MSEKVNVNGTVEVQVIDAKTGQVIEVHHFKNILTTLGKRMYRNWAAGVAPLTNPDYNVDTRITHFAVGDDATAPAVSQTALYNELDRKQVYPAGSADAGCGIELDGDDAVIFKIFFDETELNGETLREMALFSETFTSFMITRFLCGNLTKSSAVQFLIKYKIKVESA